MGRSTPWLLIVVTFAVALVAGAILATATGNWLLLAPPLVRHFLGFWLVVGATGRALAQTDKPDPVTEAKQDEEARPSEGGESKGERPEDKPHEANPVL